MHILLVEPYDTGSHGRWLRGYQRFSQHQISILSLPGQFWQWRLLGGAVPLAEQYQAVQPPPDLILASDMLDLTTFLALTRPATAHIPTAVYFHENQLLYPTGPRQKLKNHYAYMNYLSALAADHVFFNSAYHRAAFYDELPRLLKHYPDYNGLHTLDVLRDKSSVLPVGLDLARYDAHRPAQADAGPSGPPLILWNHRWEHDKNPQPFLETLVRLHNEGYAFRVVLAGENVRQEPQEFLAARQQLGNKVVHFGYVADFADYARYLWAADYIVSTARQDFFGISVVEGIYCGCWPLLPHRLNYPALVPEAHRPRTLFPNDGGLYYLLRDHLDNPQPVPAALRKHVAAFDWRRLAPRYDATLAALAQNAAST